MSRTKLVVINENTLGYIIPELPNQYSILHASVLRGAPYEVFPTSKLITSTTKVRLASRQDFEDYDVSFKGYNNPKVYEYKGK